MEFKVYNEVCNNPIKTREDVQKAVSQLCEPLKLFYSKGCTRLHIGNTGANYPLESIQFEAYSRVLWGLAPLAAGKGESDLWDIYLTGIKNGTNPEHEEYWGELMDHDLKMVNMTALGLALAIAPEKVWNPLSDKEKDNFTNWLNQINEHEIVDNNWLFFRVIVNVGLKKVGQPYNFEANEKALNRLDEFYIADGWYSDGKTNQFDYYIAFAMHYYGLIYSKLMEVEDSKRSKIYKERATIFAKDFIYWFAPNGSTVPFGRSLIYRFAHSAFWSALAFADVEALPWGEIKGIVLRNLRWWFKQPIFSTDGILTNGFVYPNLIMTEFYNGSGAPYWALKAFLCLSLDEKHPFWSQEELPLRELESIHEQQHPRMIIGRQESNVQIFTSGQFARNEGMAYVSDKYSKFVYSNIFGFSVPKGSFGLSQGAYDSTLAISEGDNFYRIRRKCDEYRIKDKMVYSKWKVFNDIEVKTWLIPIMPWHIRIHCINTNRSIDTAEGGFAIGFQNIINEVKIQTTYPNNQGIAADYPWGISGIINFMGERECEMVVAEPNTNLINPRTLIPMLKGSLQAGEHWLGCLVLGDTGTDTYGKEWSNPPTVSFKDGVLSINYCNKAETRILL